MTDKYEFSFDLQADDLLEGLDTMSESQAEEALVKIMERVEERLTANTNQNTNQIAGSDRKI